jgi:hypothetical protein
MPRTLAFLRPEFFILPDLVGYVLAMVGLSLVFMPEEMKILEKLRKTRRGIALVVFLIGLGAVISNSVQKQEDKETAAIDRKDAKTERDRLTAQISDLIGQQKASSAKEDILQAQLKTLSESMPELIGGNRTNPAPETTGPDVTLRFINPKEPLLMLINQSDVVAREMKWAVILWNVDLPDRADPLPIPFTLFDFLRPHLRGGPENLFSAPNVGSLLKPGNTLMGSASIECPDCIRGRTFWVYIKWGEGGWYSELKDVTSGSPYIPSRFSKEYLAAYFKQIESVPVSLRIPIAEL